MVKKATFRIVRFSSVDRFIGIAWNYEQAVLVSTRDFATYTEARAAIEHDCAERGVALQWFDGYYTCEDNETILRAARDCA